MRSSRDSLIEHLDDPKQALREWVRVLQPGAFNRLVAQSMDLDDRSARRPPGSGMAAETLGPRRHLRLRRRTWFGPRTLSATEVGHSHGRWIPGRRG